MADEYKFTPAVKDPNNLIRRYIDYCSQACDAPYEYHEMLAFAIMSCATCGVKYNLPIRPSGIRTNLYMILYGMSSVYRKTTSVMLANDIIGISGGCRR